jgi:hypothetical protein
VQHRAHFGSRCWMEQFRIGERHESGMMLVLESRPPTAETAVAAEGRGGLLDADRVLSL